MIADFLKGQPRVNQMSGTRVAQAVGTPALRRPVCHNDARLHEVIEGAGGQRSEWRANREAQRGVIARRTCVSDVAADGALDTRFEWEGVAPRTLRAMDADATGRPVDILDLQSPNLARSQRIHREQAENRQGGRVWTVDFAGSNVTRFDPSTQKFTEFPLPSAHMMPRFFAMDAQERIWFADFATGRIVAFESGESTLLTQR